MIHERVLLDTSVVIDFPATSVAAQALSACVSTMTLAELAYGLHTPDPLVNSSRERRYHWVSNHFGVVPFNPDAARVYGARCASVRTAGRDPKPRRFDLLIAAVAVAMGVPRSPVTNGTSEVFTTH